MTEAGTTREDCEELKKDKQRVESALEKVKAAASAHSTAGSQKLTEEVREWLEGLKVKRDNLLKACNAGRECQARRQSLQEKVENTEEWVTGARAKVDILAEELESLGDPEETETDLDKRDIEKKLQVRGQRQILEILEAALAKMRSELAGLPEEDPALLEELARVEIAIYQAEKEVVRGKEGEDKAFTRRSWRAVRV